MKAIVVCGPTGSGKTAFAHKLALQANGEIVNADSVQIYREIPILTASPSGAIKAELPYHLYNFLSIYKDESSEFSVIDYVSLAEAKIREIAANAKVPIIVGGTGMYINTLLYGYNQIPNTTDEIRSEVRDLFQKLGNIEFFAELSKLDKIAATKLNPNDSQRIQRAYEVVLQTKKSIFSYIALDNIKPLADFNFDIIFLSPSRDYLYEICNNRLKEIFKTGGIEEVRALKSVDQLKTSATKALGFREISLYLDSQLTLDEAITLAQAKTRQYAKRQVTWFNNQLPHKITLAYSNREEYDSLLLHNLEKFLSFTRSHCHSREGGNPVTMLQRPGFPPSRE